MKNVQVTIDPETLAAVGRAAIGRAPDTGKCADDWLAAQTWGDK